jgi:SHS2 domain-containing protein
MPFEELSHTADWSLRVWAADLTKLFVETARGMNALTGVILAEQPRIQRTFNALTPDAESLLVSFLSELVYYTEKDNLAFDDFDLSIDQEDGQSCLLSVVLRGAPILSSGKAIKAVTYHNLQIQQTIRGYELEIVFDV